MQKQREEERIELFDSVIKEIGANGALNEIILIGGWALMLYREHFKSDMIPYKSTSDIDFLFWQPPKTENSFPIDKMLAKKGFVKEYSRTSKECRYKHHLLDIDFLIPLKGSNEKENTATIPGYGVKATRMRYLDIATSYTVKVKYKGMMVTVPHPSAYVYGKYLVAPIRKDREKAEKDIDTANQLSVFLVENKDLMEVLFEIIDELHPSWNEKFFKSISSHNAPFSNYISDVMAERKVSGFMEENGLVSDRKDSLLLAERIIVEHNLQKHRNNIYAETLKGLKPNKILSFVAKKGLLLWR